MYFLFFKLFINNVNDIRAFGLSQYAATSVTEVSNVDVDFTEAGLMCERIVIIQKINELTFLMQHTGSRICYLSLRKKHGFF